MELCRPLLEQANFHEPASTRDIAKKLFVSEAAVKQHLLRMYDKLEVPDDGNRRLALANLAFERGILTSAEVAGEAAPATRAGDALAEGRAAFARRAWEVAYTRLADADAAGALVDAADLAALGEAALWTARPAESIAARQRAFALYVDADQRDAAARVAADLFINFIVRGKFACGGGWLAKARRLVDGRPDASALGYVAAMEALGLIAVGKLDDGAACATTAMQAGSEHHDQDSFTLGQTFMACVLVRRGQTDEAMKLFDEAMATATSGELGALATGVVYCRTLCTCLDQMDYRRAHEWTETIEQSRGGTGLPGDCRAHFASVLTATGDWQRAETEARTACEEAMRFDFGHVGLAAYELGVLSLRKGELASAEAAFKRAHELGALAQPGVSLLRLAHGDASAALASIESACASTPSDPLSRARLLPAKIEIALAAGDLAGARTAASELAAIAERIPTLAGAAAEGSGRVAAASGSHADAIADLRRSCRFWLDAGMPFEAARARRELANALAASGDGAGAALEAQVAREAFERLGLTER
ncbi:MAG: response regulator transcription factor [Deltaproteobacteria bacterium]|nr:response regulator transcription factor [Deltaproteobacteria bacterium]